MGRCYKIHRTTGLESGAWHRRDDGLRLGLGKVFARKSDRVESTYAPNIIQNSSYYRKNSSCCFVNITYYSRNSMLNRFVCSPFTCRRLLVPTIRTAAIKLRIKAWRRARVYQLEYRKEENDR